MAGIWSPPTETVAGATRRTWAPRGLAVWNATGVLLLAAAVWAFDARRSREQSRVDDDAKRVANVDATIARLAGREPTAGPLVLVIGNSVLRAATARQRMPRLLRRSLTRPGGRPPDVAFARMSATGLSMRNLADRVEAIVAVGPTLLVLEVDPLFSWPALEQFFGGHSLRAAQWADRARRHVAKSLRPADQLNSPLNRSWWRSYFGIGDAGPRMPKGTVGEQARKAVRARWGMLLHWEGRTANEADVCYRVGRRLLERARAAGIRTCLLEVPLAQGMRDKLPSFFADRERLLGELPADAWLRQDVVPPEGYFQDAAHMNEAGARWFSRWAAAQIGAELDRARGVRRGQ